MKSILVSIFGVVLLTTVSITQAGPQLQRALIEKPYDDLIQKLSDDRQSLIIFSPLSIEILPSVSRAKILCGAFTVPVTGINKNYLVSIVIRGSCINSSEKTANSSIDIGVNNTNINYTLSSESDACLKDNNERQFRIPLDVIIPKEKNNLAVTYRLECHEYGTSSAQLTVMLDTFDIEIHPDLGTATSLTP